MCSERAELLPAAAGMPAAHNDIAMTSCRTRAAATLGIARFGRGAAPPKGVAPRNGARRTRMRDVDTAFSCMPSAASSGGHTCNITTRARGARIRRFHPDETR